MHKPLILLILCSLTILCNHSFSQQKLIKLYEKRDFEKADKKVNKELESLKKGKVDIEDPRVKYVKALLYNEKGYSIFIPDSAYTYLISSSQILTKVKDVKLSEDLNENLFNTKLIDQTMLAICENAFEIVKRNDTETAYNKYLEFSKPKDQTIFAFKASLGSALSTMIALKA